MALYYELAILDSTVEKTLCPEVLNTLTTKKCRELAKQLSEEEERIRTVWKEQVYSLKEIREAELYVCNRQGTIIFLANRLDKYKDEVASTASRNKPRNELYDQAEQTLRRLLEFIETYFNRFYDTRANVPNYYYALAQKELQEKLAQFQKSMDAGDANDKLITTFIKCFEKNIEARQRSNISFRDVIYWKELMNEVLHSASTEESMLDVLLYMNYNSASVIHCCKQIFEEQLDALNGEDEKLELLRELHKKIQYIIPRPGAGLHPDWPSLQEWMLGWMEEIRKGIHAEEKEVVKAVATTDEEIQRQRLKTPLSVGQLGLFFWLLFETGLLQCANKSWVVRRIIELFSSKKTESIAFESLRSKLYRKGSSDIRAVKDAIIVLLNKVREVERG